MPKTVIVVMTIEEDEGQPLLADDQVQQALRQPGHDPAQDDDRCTIADALLADQLTQPDSKHGASRHGGQDGHRRQRCISKAKLLQDWHAAAHLGHDHCLTVGLQGSQRHCQIPGVLVELVPSLLSLLLQAFQGRDDGLSATGG